ncbi:MAG: UpxY family transcription antiterminator [Bacteroidales bacterium]|nr:UpxY family transcription antiterminator [Bacteroidales bacterium]
METLKTYPSRTFNRINTLKCWYALYTRPNHEKEVFRRLKEQQITAYLPLYTTIKQWSDRKKKVEIPLFSCYVFVHIAINDYYRVLNTSGGVRYVTFEGKAVAIPEKQIYLVKSLLDQDIQIEEVHDMLYSGAKVEIASGPLKGISGELIDFAGKKRVNIRLNEIRKSIVISVPMHLLKLIE